MKTNAKPVAQKPLKDWLDQGMKEEIFNKVPDGEAITWCSPLVVQPKPKFTEMKSEVLEFHMIRARIDMKIPSHEAKPVHPITKSRILHLASTRLQDLYEAGPQTRLPPISSRPLNKTSRKLSTPWGNYRPQQLVFGTN